MAVSSSHRRVLVASGRHRLEGAFEVSGRARGVVVFAEPAGASHDGPRTRYLAAEFRRAGFATLLLDLLVEQEVTRGARDEVPLLARRLDDAVRWTVNQAAAAGLPVMLFGSGTGAAAALEVAARRADAVVAVVSCGGRPDLAPAQALARVRAATLLLAGGRDARAIELNEAAYELLGGVKSLTIVGGATSLFQEPAALEKAAALAADWFTRHAAIAAPRHAAIS